MKKVIINENQKGFLFHNGRFVKLLGAGKYPLFGAREIEIVSLKEPLISAKCELDTLLANSEVAKLTSVCEVADQQLALHYTSGKFDGVLRRGKYAFWSVLERHEYQLVDISTPEVAEDVPQYIFAKLPTTVYTKVEVAQYQKARLYFDQKLIRILDAGTYYFWKNNIRVDVNLVDTRLTRMEITGQEIMTQDTGDIYIVVHSGSRHLGVEVADYYQEQGRMALWGGARYQIGQLIETLKSEGRFQEIQPAVTALKKEHKISIPKDLAYVEGKLFEDYIHDMRIVQHFAVLNRKAMMDVILSGMGFTKADEFTTIHNYIDTDAMVLRKGSVSAKKGEKLLIPINMRDGSLICIGKGNPEWNCSAPHGAGRLMSRRAAFSTLSMEQYRKEMKGIYSTCVVPDTLDESPMAYKSMEEIIAQIEPTAQIAERVKPVYNFKAAE